MIRIWDIMSQHVERTVHRLEYLFSMYTDDYLDHCRRVQKLGYVLFIVTGYCQVPWILSPLMLENEPFVCSCVYQ
jgi:hypothetical protein